MDNLIPVTITIADRSYRIKVKPADEEAVRKTVRFINERLLDFKRQFAGKDMQDYVAMVLIWYATQQQGELEKEVTSQDLTEKLDRLEELIDRNLQNWETVV